MRRGKALDPSGFESGNCRSSRKQPERFEEETRRTEALWIEGPPWAVQRACRPQRAVNVEQASKRLMRKPTRPIVGEGCQRPGSERTRAPVGSAGVVTVACTREGNSSNTGSPVGGVARAKPESRKGQAGPVRVAERPVVPGKPGNAGGGKGPQARKGE